MSRPIKLILVLVVFCGVSPTPEIGFAQGPEAYNNGYPAWSPDGNRIAFWSNRDGNGEIYVMNSDGGGQSNLTNHDALERNRQRWSRSGDLLAFTSRREGDDEIFIMRENGSGVQRVTFNAGKDEYPDWMPGDSVIVFNSDRTGNKEIFEINIRTRQLKNLTNDPAQDEWPAISFDGKQLLFQSDRSGNFDVFLLDLAEAKLTQLTVSDSNDSRPAWSPDRKSIVFSSDRSGNQDIYKMDLESKRISRLTTHHSLDHAPDWSPDGKRIAFWSHRDGTAEIYTMDAEGRSKVRLTGVGAKPGAGPKFSQITNLPGDERDITYSPDGSRIGFSSNTYGGWDVFVVDLAAREVTQITEMNGDEMRPQWSPDGRSLTFQHKVEQKSRILRVSRAGGPAEPLLPDYDAARPFWSPDGRRIVFDSSRDGSPDVWMVTLENKHATKLTSFPGAETNYGFSHDGNWVLFYTRASSNENLWRVDINTLEIVQLTQNSGHEWQPRWSPVDNKVLFYTTWDNRMTDIWQLDEQKKLTQISNNVAEDFGPMWSPDGRHVVFHTVRTDVAQLVLTTVDGKKETVIDFPDELNLQWAPPLGWSPDGSNIAFVANNQKDHIYQVPVSGGRLSKLTSLDAYEQDPHCSPDGQWVAFTVSNDLFIYSIKDRTARKVPGLNPEHDYFTPRWSPDSRKLAFADGAGGAINSNDLWVFSLVDSSLKQVTTSGGVSHPVWAEDGEAFIFSYDSSANYRYDIWRINGDGTDARPLLSNSFHNFVSDVSADGKQLLFHSNLSGKNRIYKMPTAGGAYQEIVTELDGGAWASWSPDGKSIAFVSSNNRENRHDVYVMPAAGGPARRVTNNHNQEEWPAWSADGQYLLFRVNMGSSDIWSVDVRSYLEML